MKICYGKISEEIKNIVQTKAKYQKVMLLFDNFVSNLEITEIYNSIKEFCIYNQSNVKDVDLQELNNGYRLVIFLCQADNFLKINYEREEFINVFCPKDSFILPYFLNKESLVDASENYLLLENKTVEISMMSSLCLNQFYNYLKNLLSFQNKEFDFSFLNQEITHHNLLSSIDSLKENFEFIDIKILKKCDIEYEKIMLIDLLLIDAFSLLIDSVKNQSLMLVDVYKSAKENGDLIEKFYSLYNNEAVLNLIVLNYNCLSTFCAKTKQKILNCLSVYDYSNEEVNKAIEKIKNYSKYDKDLMIYLYLYNIFGV